jgi:hypothetical protein
MPLPGLEPPVDSGRERLEARKMERAKGPLMTELGMTEPEAFRWIQRTAMDRRTTMRAVAEAALAAGFDITADTSRRRSDQCVRPPSPLFAAFRRVAAELRLGGVPSGDTRHTLSSPGTSTQPVAPTRF